jgi:hypothetical protein
VSGIEKLDLTGEATLDIYLRWGIIEWDHHPGEVLLSYQWVMIGRELIADDGKMSNSFPADWRRK